MGEQARVLDGYGSLQRQADKEFEVAFAERDAAGPPHGHHAFDLRSREQRRDHQAFVFFLSRAGDLDAARVAVGVVDVLGVSALDQATDDAYAQFNFGLLQRLGNIADRHDGAIVGAPVIGEEDRAGVDTQQFLGVVRDAVHDLGDIQGRGNVAADLGERRGFARAALRFVE